MIESEEKRKRIIEHLECWCDHVKATSLLRNYDIPSLVETILSEFYTVTFCCGHLGHWNDGVHIGFYSYEGRTDETTEGLYCKDCAGEYKKKLGAWEIKELA